MSVEEGVVRSEGFVLSFNETSGTGYIRCTDNSIKGDVSFHRSELQCEKGRRTVSVGKTVEFITIFDDYDRHKAANITGRGNTLLPAAVSQSDSVARVGKGGEKKCHECNEVGHIRKDCPERRVTKGEVECRYCHNMGHVIRNCPNKSSDECFKCKEVGHFARQCPNRSGDRDSGANGGSNEEVVCHYCKEPGHFVRRCPKKSGDSEEVVCHACNEAGHIVRNCPKKSSDGGSNGGRKEDIECYSCRGYGHFARDCRKSNGCYNCGGFGHFARDCATY